MTDLRAEFESWILAQGRDAGKYEDGEYYVPAVERQWEAWQASRAALKVELPELYECSWGHGFYYEDDIKQMLDKAGISYE